MTQNQTVKLWQVGSSTPIISNPPPPHLPLPCSSPPSPALSPPLREAFFKQKNVVVFLAGCACRLLPTPGFSRRPVLFLALISGCWKFGNRCLKPCKRFLTSNAGAESRKRSPFLPSPLALSCCASSPAPLQQG